MDWTLDVFPLEPDDQMRFEHQFRLVDPAKVVVEEIIDWCCEHTSENFIVLEIRSSIVAGGIARLTGTRDPKYYRRNRKETEGVECYLFRFYETDAVLFKMRWM